MTDLVEDIDAAAAELLKRATAPDKDEDDKATLVTLAERTKAFDSVVDWAKVRQTLVPPDKTPSKFEAIKGALDGTGKSRKRGRNRAEAEEDVGSGPGDRDSEAGSGSETRLNGDDSADGIFAS